MLTSQNHLSILLIIILHTAFVCGNTSAGSRLGQASFRVQHSALCCPCGKYSNSVLVGGANAAIFTYRSVLSGKELLTPDDGPTEIPGSQLQISNSKLMADKQTRTHKYGKAANSSHGGPPQLSLHASSVHLSTKINIQFVNSLVSVVVQTVFTRLTKKRTINDIFSLRRQAEPHHFWTAGGKIFKPLIFAGGASAFMSIWSAVSPAVSESSQRYF